jgi:hypothetical protein
MMAATALDTGCGSSSAGRRLCTETRWSGDAMTLYKKNKSVTTSEELPRLVASLIQLLLLLLLLLPVTCSPRHMPPAPPAIWRPPWLLLR